LEGEVYVLFCVSGVKISSSKMKGSLVKRIDQNLRKYFYFERWTVSIIRVSKPCLLGFFLLAWLLPFLSVCCPAWWAEDNCQLMPLF